MDKDSLEFAESKLAKLAMHSMITFLSNYVVNNQLASFPHIQRNFSNSPAETINDLYQNLNALGGDLFNISDLARNRDEDGNLFKIPFDDFRGMRIAGYSAALDSEITPYLKVIFTLQSPKDSYKLETLSDMTTAISNNVSRSRFLTPVRETANGSNEFIKSELKKEMDIRDMIRTAPLLFSYGIQLACTDESSKYELAQLKLDNPGLVKKYIL